MKMENVVLTSAIVSVVSLGYAYYTGRKLDKAYSLIVDNMSQKVDVKISDDIINAAVEMAVERETKAQVRTLTSTILYNVKKDLETEVKKSVTKSYTSIDDLVTAEVKKQVADIDISEMKKDIRKEAKEKILAKFNSDLDNLLDDYNTNLSNVSKIYSSIAESMTKKNETTLKIG